MNTLSEAKFGSMSLTLYNVTMCSHAQPRYGVKRRRLDGT